MITDSYSKMMPDVSMRSMLQSSDFEEDLGVLIREQRRQEAASDREKELSMYRSGSAPPTVEGALSAVGGLFEGAGLSGGKGFASDEELRADPSYVNYYYSNVNMNPRLPPPLLSKEDWRFAQRLHGGGAVVGGIGDRRKVGRNGGDENRSIFSAQPGYGGKEENGAGAEWGGDGLIGLPGLGLGRQKSIAEIFQDDMIHHPSRPASRNAFDDNVESSDSQFGHLLGGVSAAQSIGSSASHSYASALGGSLSRSTTPDPQLIARAPSPRIPPIGGGRSSSMSKSSNNGPNSYNGVSLGLSESVDLGTAFSGLNISTNGMVVEENYAQSQTQHELDDRHNHFNLQNDHNHLNHSFTNNMESRRLNLNSDSQPVRGIYPYTGKGSAVGTNSPMTLNGGSSPSHYLGMENMNSSIPNYGLNGYANNPTSPPMMGQLGSGNLPPLFENVAASAGGINGFDPRAHGGGLSMGPNLLAAAMELQNLRGNQLSLMDPMYLQYLRSQGYAAAQLGALNDPSFDRENVSNSYMDLHRLQKAYIDQALSPQKSQFGVSYLGKYGGANHGFYGNPAFGNGMSYPGSPLLPNSPVGSRTPIRHGERNMRFASGIRNLTGGGMGALHSEVCNLDGNFTSTLLDEFKSNKTKCFELSEIAGHVVEFSADQYGSRFIQQKLETASEDEKYMVFQEIMPQALSLMTDVFGNYVIQKFFEHGSTSQIRELADQLTGHVLTLSLQMYGCRVIQKAIEVVDLDQQTKMVTELDGHIMRCVRDQNGNHVIQKSIECIPEEAIQFIVSTFYDQVMTLSTHPYGCRVIQRVLEHCHDPKTQQIMMDAIIESVCMLAQDQYGNYVVQHVLEHGKPDERSVIIKKLTGQIVQMSQQKFASNVVEKCLSFGTQTERQVLVTEMLGTTDENEPLQAMMKDQYANYVVQKVLETCEEQQLELILNRIKVHLNTLKKYTYGKHIVARVEKLVAAGERRISTQNTGSRAHAYPYPAA